MSSKRNDKINRSQKKISGLNGEGKMSVTTKRELEVKEVYNYPNPTIGKRRFMVIEYEVTRKEINRYEVFQRIKNEI